MYRKPASFSPFAGLLAYGQSFIGAMSGLEMVSQSLMTAMQFQKLPGGGPKGRNPVDRSRYIPAGPRCNCGERGISPKLLRRYG